MSAFPITRPPLWIAIHLPKLPLEVFHPHWLDEVALVIFEQHRVLTMSTLAHRAGVQSGMRLSSVQMLTHDAQIKTRDTAKETATLQAVAMACLRFSPQVCLAENASVLINVGASLRLFGGIRRLRHLIINTVKQLGLTPQWGMAITARGAWLLAQRSRSPKVYQPRSALSLNRLTQRLDALPTHLLPAAQRWQTWLTGIGCQTLGALRLLPRAGLQRRCDKDMLHSLDTAYNQKQEMHQWVIMPTAFNARIELPDRFENAELIFHFARTLLLQLCGWLTQQQLATTCLQFQLEHERGRQAVLPTVMHIPLAQASWHEEHLSRLLKEHLNKLPLTAPAIAIRLEALHLSPMHAPNADLFPEPGGNQEEQATLFELLVARLGADNVLHPAPQADHRPEVANQWVSIMQKGHSKKEHIREQTQAPSHRPTWLLPKPQLLEVRQHRPHYQSPLKLMSPAERIEAGWWNGQLVTRDYFVAENAQHLRCWIYRERIGHAQPARDDEVWYLHGVFG